MTPRPRTVRVEDDLAEQLDELVAEGRIPPTFTGQVRAGLELLVRQAEEERTRRSAKLVGADRERADRTYRRLRQRP